MPSLPNIYASRNYRLLVAIPVALLLLSFGVIYLKGVPQGIDLRGGILITTETNSSVDAEALKASLSSQLGVPEVSVKTAPGTSARTGVEIELEQNEKLAAAELALVDFYAAYDRYSEADFRVASVSSALESGNASNMDQLRAQLAEANASRAAANAELGRQAVTIRDSVQPFVAHPITLQTSDPKALKTQVADAYEEAKLNYRGKVIGILESGMQFTDFTYKEVSPSLSRFFLQKTIQVLIVSFILTTIVVLIVFRSIVPSFAVIFGAVNDLVFALGAMSLFNIPLTLASVGALLMLVGFSLDTDMLLTIRILKRTEGRASDRAYGAMKTGVFMNLTCFAAFGLLFILSTITQIPTYYQISAVVLCGIVGDLIATWCTNAVIVLWSAEAKAGKG
ncbi:MAG: hypothetical protein PHF51_04055 [Candidatus ainarchaeum sp.]|nr:hypothetical protein [Candidatus ainarchaeum sp.]